MYNKASKECKERSADLDDMQNYNLTGRQSADLDNTYIMMWLESRNICKKRLMDQNHTFLYI